MRSYSTILFYYQSFTTLQTITSNISTCSSPATYTNLRTGFHTFEVRAINIIGNAHPTPAKFEWKILTPAEALQQLINDIQNNPQINDRVKASLIRILDRAFKLLNDDNPRNDIAVCILLNIELRVINTYERIRLLDSNTVEQLRTQVNTIKSSIDC